MRAIRDEELVKLMLPEKKGFVVMIVNFGIGAKLCVHRIDVGDPPSHVPKYSASRSLAELILCSITG